MNIKNKWFSLFAFGLALVILTSVSTAAFILKMTEDKIQSANSILEAQKTASGVTQQAALLNLASGSEQTQSTERSEATANQLTSTTTNPTYPTTSATTSATTESGSVVPTESTTLQSTAPSSTLNQLPRQSETAKTIDVIGSATVNPSATTKNASGSTTTPIKYITVNQARQIILDRIGTANLKVVEIKLENSDYPPKYEIKLTDGKYKYEAKVHAVTGLVIEIDKEESDD
jgi:uncharacterized membrane protein YkoI